MGIDGGGEKETHWTQIFDALPLQSCSWAFLEVDFFPISNIQPIFLQIKVS